MSGIMTLMVWDDDKAESLTNWLNKGSSQAQPRAILNGARIDIQQIRYTSTELKQEIRNHNHNHAPKIEYVDVSVRMRGSLKDWELVEDQFDLYPNDMEEFVA